MQVSVLTLRRAALWTGIVLIIACHPTRSQPVRSAPYIEAPHPGADTNRPETASPVPSQAEDPESILENTPGTRFHVETYQATLGLQANSFTGTIKIVGSVLGETRSISLHASGLEFHEAYAEGEDRRRVALRVVASGSDAIALHPQTRLKPGKLVIVLKYRGRVDETRSDRHNASLSRGVLRREWNSEVYYFTHAQPNFARRMFPCVDEPDVKARWKLELIVSRDADAVSNTPIELINELASSRKSVAFEWTPPMSSYLVAFAVGPFARKAMARTKSGMPITLLVPRTLELDDRVLALAGRAVDMTAEWTGIAPYFSKLDFVLVPDVGWRGMENLGLIFINVENASDRDVVFHEISHHWFGNLVTPKGWEHIWLSESLATWFSIKIAQGLGATDAPGRPLVSSLLALKGGARVRNRIDGDRYTADNFYPSDKIDRGTHILRLLEAKIGLDGFQALLRAYLRRNAFGSVSTDDFVEVIDALGGSEVAQLFAVLDQHGPPVVRITVSCGSERHSATLTPSVGASTCIVYDGDGMRRIACAQQGQNTVPLVSERCPRWVYPNAASLGLYLVDLSKAQARSLLVHGWDYLLPAEKAALFFAVEDPIDRIAVFEKLANEHGTIAVQDELKYVTELSRYIPDEISSDFVDWLKSRYIGPGMYVSASKIVDIWNSDARGILGLWGRWSDEHLAIEALSLLKMPSLSDDLADALTSIAVGTDVQRGVAFLEAAINTKGAARTRALIAIGKSSLSIEILRKARAKTASLLGVEVAHLLSGACVGTATLQPLRTELPNVSLRQWQRILSQSQLCSKRKADARPFLQSWLGRTRAARHARRAPAEVPLFGCARP
jgi:hypothetical protein